jgi:iron uptake system component EfeO
MVLSRERAASAGAVRMRRRPAAVGAAGVVSALLAGALSACGGSSAPPQSAPPAPHAITVSATACGTGWQHPTAGTQILQVRNTSRSVLEVQLIDPDNGAVYAQIEGLAPGTVRSMPIDAGSGRYAFTCSGTSYGTRNGPEIQIPGQERGGPAILPLTQIQINAVTGQAHAYVASGLATLTQQTSALAAAVRRGNLGSARTAWLTAHLTWERLGSAYGMFDAYDDEINGVPFGLPGGVNDPGFTGFYRLEYGLWHDQSAAVLAKPATQLATAARSLQAAWISLELPTGQAVGDLALRTHEILESAMQSQLSGQDDFGSGTTLATVAAGIDATRAQLGILRSLLVTRYPQTAELYRSLDRLQNLVDAAKTSRGWTPAHDLTTGQREKLDAAAGQTVELLAPIPVIFEQERPAL